MNCRGLANVQKRKDVLQYLKTKQYSICCLQDTHFIPDFESSINEEWKSGNYFSHNSSSSRGVAILFNDSVDVDVRKVKTDSGGNIVVLDLKINEFEITLASLYAPNTDSPAFFLTWKIPFWSLKIPILFYVETGI